MSRRAPWLVLALLCACNRTHPSLLPEDAPPDLAVAPTAPQLKIVADDPKLLDGPMTKTSFSLATLRELYVRLQLPSLPADPTWVTLRIFTPTGETYAERRLPYGAAASKQVTPPGASGPVNVLLAKPIAGGFGLDEIIVVGGTNFVRYPRPGPWRISMTVDGSTAFEQTVILGGM